MQSDCCPTRLRGVLDAGATRLGMHATGGAPGGVSAMIDHTLLKADATRAEIEKLCREAAEYQFRHRVRQPGVGPLARRACAARGVGVCSVVGFPLGATTPDVKNFETRRAIFDGAREIDMVINVGALKSGDLRTVERDIEAVVEPAAQCGVTSKVIIEAALLTDEEKITASTLTKAAGADFVKTSTGFGPGGATVADVALMRRVVGAEMGVKAAGGVRDLEGLKAMVAAGATRVGASAGVKIVQESRGEKTYPDPPAGTRKAFHWSKSLSPRRPPSTPRNNSDSAFSALSAARGFVRILLPIDPSRTATSLSGNGTATLCSSNARRIRFRSSLRPHAAAAARS